MGGGGGGDQNVTQEFKPPEYTREGWQAYLNSGTALSQRGYQQSGLPTVAPINDFQHTANQLAYDRALYGADDLNAARGAAMNASQGNYANPYAQNIQELASGGGYNPALEGFAGLANSGSNPALQGFAEMAQGGANPYTEEMIANNARNMSEAYANGTASQNDMSAAMSGAFGGSAHELQQQAGASNLARQVGQMATGTRQSQYQSDQQNRLAALSGYAGTHNSDYANTLQALGGYAGTYNSDVGNQLQANQQGIGSWQGDIGNILSGAGLAGGLSQQDFTSMRGLMDAGNNQNNYYQRLMDSLNNEWNTESQYDYNMNEYLGSVLGRASGSYGGTATTGGGGSNLGGLLGLGAAGAGLYSLFRP